MKNIEEIIKSLSKKYKLPYWCKKRVPFEVLISTILSQRTKDKITYSINKKLFSKLKTLNAFDRASEKEIRDLIRGSGFYNVKAKRIKRIVKILKKKYKGKVPKELNELTSLPGVGKKTASCVLVYGFGKACIPVDVHVFVISKRLGLTKSKTPEKAQEDLEKTTPKKLQIKVNWLFVEFGKDICQTRKPKCKICPIKKHCEYYKNK